MFYFDKINNKKILKSTYLDGLLHCFTTRESFIKSADSAYLTSIEENRKILCKYFKISDNNLISSTQTHSANIAVATPAKNDYPDTDAIILTNKEQAVFLNFADCTPIILFDKLQNICAIVHAGWKGTANQIAPKTVKKMVNEFNSKPENIFAAIGPAIGQCCFCIGEEVYVKLKETVSKPKDLFIKKDEKIYADLKKINCQQLLATGIQKIDLCDYCTSCANELFFSYRKENGTTNRHSAVVKLV